MQSSGGRNHSRNNAGAGPCTCTGGGKSVRVRCHACVKHAAVINLTKAPAQAVHVTNTAKVMHVTKTAVAAGTTGTSGTSATTATTATTADSDSATATSTATASATSTATSTATASSADTGTDTATATGTAKGIHEDTVANQAVKGVVIAKYTPMFAIARPPRLSGLGTRIAPENPSPVFRVKSSNGIDSC